MNAGDWRMGLEPAEPGVEQWQLVPIEVLLDTIEARRGREAPVIVAIDGRSASGKSTLAGRLADRLPEAVVVHTDDLAWNEPLFQWQHLLRDGILRPAREGHGVRFTPPVWGEHGRPGAIEVPAGTRTLLIEGIFRSIYGVSGLGYDTPELLEGATSLGFMIMPNYRAWVVVASITVCIATWYVIEKTKLGAYLRAGTENPRLVEAFGVNVPLMITLTYGFGVGLAGFAGVLAAPASQVGPLMGSNLIIVVFAVVVIGGMGSILGSVVTGLGLGIIEGMTKVFWPEASATVVFMVMAVVLMIRPAGLFGREK